MSGTNKPLSARHFDGPGAFAEAFDVSRETIAALHTYDRTLRQWQNAQNLVAPNTLPDIWHRHFADSAQLLAHAPRARRWVDLGSGAGFPGLVVAAMLCDRGGGSVSLYESNSGKCAFLREVARQMGVGNRGTTVEIVNTRIERITAGDKLGKVDAVTARALAPLDRLLGLCSRFFDDHTIGLFPKGREVDQEIEAARGSWRFSHELHQSLTDCEARVVALTRPQPK